MHGSPSRAHSILSLFVSPPMIHTFARHQLRRCSPRVLPRVYHARSRSSTTEVETKTRAEATAKAEVKARAAPAPNPAITPGSENHNSLPTFLAYASLTSLSPASTVYIGTHYEYTVAASLRRLGFALTRTGRASDQGIDLLGHWAVPSLPTPLRVLVQCKARSAKLRPETVRELEGAFVGAPAGWRGAGVLGLLAARREASRGVREALGRSRWPMGYLMVGLDGRAEQFLWNRVAAECGLEGVGVTVRYLPGRDGLGEDGELKSEVVLTWEGRALPDVEGGDEVGEEPVAPVQAAGWLEEANPVKRKRGRPRKTPVVEDAASHEALAS